MKTKIDLGDSVRYPLENGLYTYTTAVLYKYQTVRYESRLVSFLDRINAVRLELQTSLGEGK
jgi:hypothetical protein